MSQYEPQSTKVSCLILCLGELTFPRRPRSSKPFPLLELPAEVRLRIYDFVFPSQRGFVRFFSKDNPHHGNIKPANVKINLLLTCRLIHNEALITLYKANNFCIMPLTRPGHDAQGKAYSRTNSKWLHSMPLECRNNITSIELRLPIPDERDLSAYCSMTKLFPRLRTMTMFFDKYSTRRLADRITPLNDFESMEYVEFYFGLKRLLPRCSTVRFDDTVIASDCVVDEDDLDGDEPSSLYDSLMEIVYNVWYIPMNEVGGLEGGQSYYVKGGQSYFVTQEEEWADTWYERDCELYHLLIEEYGQRAYEWCAEDCYWDLRWKRGVWEKDVDNDSTDERNANLWDIHEEAEKRKQENWWDVESEEDEEDEDEDGDEGEEGCAWDGEDEEESLDGKESAVEKMAMREE